MADPVVVNSDGGNNSIVGVIVGILALVVFAYLFVVYLLPAVNKSSTPAVQVPDTVKVEVAQ